MVDLRRWITRTSGHAVLAGALAAGLAGCQSAATVESIDDGGTVPVPEATPLTPHYEDLPVLPAPATAEGESVDSPDAFTDLGQPEEVPLENLEPVKPDGNLEESVPTELKSETPVVEKADPDQDATSEEPVATTEPVASGAVFPTDPTSPTPSNTTPAEPVTTVDKTPQGPTEFTPETVKPDSVVQPDVAQTVPTPESSSVEEPSTPPLLPDSVVPEAAIPEPTGLSTGRDASNDDSTTVTETTSKAEPELPEEKTDETVVEEPTFEPTEKEPDETSKPEIRKAPLPFEDAGEETIPAPFRKSNKASDEVSSKVSASSETTDSVSSSDPVEGASEDSSDESADTTTDGESTDPEDGLTNLPQINPGPSQPFPAETPLSTGLTLETERRVESRLVASVRPAETPAEAEIVTDDSVRAIEIASFGGSADGIVFGSDGTAFVSHRDSISKVSLDGEVAHWAKTGTPQGHTILPDGTHLVCDAEQRAVLHLDEGGQEIRKVVTKSDGYFLRAPNDIAADREGGFYFTDPGYARIQNAIGKVHYVAADGSVSVVASKLAFPEGVAISPDGTRLFVVESQKNRVVVFDINSAGDLGGKEVFSELPRNTDGSESRADGLAIDREGWLYVAHRTTSRVEVIGPDGDWRTSFLCPNTDVRNLAFSRDYSKLFVTGAGTSGRSGGRLLIIDFAGRN